MPRKGYKQTLEHIKNVSKALRGKKKPPFSLEHRKHISEVMIKRWQDPRDREKFIKSRKGVKFSEVRKKSMRGHTGVFERTKEHRKNLSKAGKGYKNSQWLGGTSFEPYSFEFNKELKEIIKQRDNHKCQLCGTLECEEFQSLGVHHIDYDKKNNSPSNLVTLCRSCNSKVNINREYWTKYFKREIKLANFKFVGGRSVLMRMADKGGF